ncbi:MAG TPA: ribosome silencing factor [Acidobacteriota bacterium]|nr:ribosome silencing factor [Acidobacteriota bacterium]
MNEALKIAVNAADDKKASDLVVLDISKIASFANYFLICTGDSSRQMQAIADEVEKRLKVTGVRPSHVEGYQNSEWILLDYMDLVIHIFSRNARVFYDLERLWRDARKMDAGAMIEKKEVRPSHRKTMKSTRSQSE